jgi:hypothetical protein
MLIIDIHKAMRLVHHVLLAAAGISEHFIAEKAKIAKLDALCNIS